MTEPARVSRREFLKRGAAAGAGLVVAFSWPRSSAAAEPSGDAEAARLNAFIRIAPDGEVTLFAPIPEIGQGVRTALPMILAEELRADWARVRIEQAPADPAFGPMAVGGSDSVAAAWIPLRRAGAAARGRLEAAAAQAWGVSPEECVAESGHVVHRPSGRRLAFGGLAAAAAELPTPDPIRLSDPAQFSLIGTPVPRVDLDPIVRGTARYGIDVRVPEMRFAVVERCPVQGGRVRRFDPAPALAVPGVEKVAEIAPLVLNRDLYGAVRGGVAVIARDTWSAMRGREALSVDWDEGRNAQESDTALGARMRAALAGPARTLLRDEGDAPRAWAAAARRLEADYQLPILAHASLEPMNFTAHARADGCEMWGPTQDPLGLRQRVAAALQVPPESVRIQPTLEGGGFGRRLSVDYGVEAALVSRAAGLPVQVVWTREDDLRHDYYRAPSLHRLRAALDGEGRPVAWHHHLVNPPLLDHIMGPGAEHPEIYDVEGGANLPYAIPHLRFEYTPVEIGLQLGSWRSVSNSFNVFVVESFVDEIAAAARVDPLELRRRLLGEPREVAIELPLRGRRGRPTWDTGILARVLEVAAESAGWGRSLPPGRGRGIACAYFKRTYAAHVAEVSVENGEARVHRIVAAVDCGRVVNPDGVAAQVEGAAIDGVASVFKWAVTLARGRVEQGNFDGYPLLQLAEAPEIDVHIVPSERPPSGIGEPPYPSVAPAIANAIHAATGKRIRRLPVRPGDLVG